MGFPIRITVTFDPPPQVSKRALKEAMREGYRVMGDAWYKKFLPLHFKPGARERYGHQPRKRTWIKRKVKAAQRGIAQEGGLVDNVYTGFMRKLLLSHKLIRAYPTRASVVMIGPSYISMRPRDPVKPNKAKEITTVSTSERKELADVLGKTVFDRLAKLRSKETHTIS